MTLKHRYELLLLPAFDTIGKRLTFKNRQINGWINGSWIPLCTPEPVRPWQWKTNCPVIELWTILSEASRCRKRVSIILVLNETINTVLQVHNWRTYFELVYKVTAFRKPKSFSVLIIFCYWISFHVLWKTCTYFLLCISISPSNLRFATSQPALDSGFLSVTFHE
jgi:hypothetical protein